MTHHFPSITSSGEEDSTVHGIHAHPHPHRVEAIVKGSARNKCATRSGRREPLYTLVNSSRSSRTGNFDGSVNFGIVPQSIVVRHARSMKVELILAHT
jgi:hypothetical protein